jgi:ferredoxin
VRIEINPEKCQGHGRCYDLSPELFTEDEEGYGKVLADGSVPPAAEREARTTASNCPEHAIALIQEA